MWYDGKKRMLDSMLRHGAYVSIGEFKVSSTDILHAAGQIRGYELMLLMGTTDGKPSAYRVAHDAQCAAKFVAFEDEPDAFCKHASGVNRHLDVSARGVPAARLPARGHDGCARNVAPDGIVARIPGRGRRARRRRRAGRRDGAACMPTVGLYFRAQRRSAASVAGRPAAARGGIGDSISDVQIRRRKRRPGTSYARYYLR